MRHNGLKWLCCLCALAASAPAALEVSCWNAAAEFNDSANPDAANPSGVWSYGWKKTLTDKFYFFRTPSNAPPYLSGWCNASGVPAIAHNDRSVTTTVPNIRPVIYKPHALNLHPGSNGEYAVLRFTAPVDGSYRISGQFYAFDDNGKGTTTDVWVLANNRKTDAFSGKVDCHAGPRSASFTSHTFILKARDTLDFQIGYGASKNYQYDSTGLSALIEKVR